MEKRCQKVETYLTVSPLIHSVPLVVVGPDGLRSW